MRTTETLKVFEAGKTYQTRSICNYDCIYSYTIVKRTAKMVTARDDDTGEVKRFRVSIWNNREEFKPHGRYSMAATISADKETA